MNRIIVLARDRNGYRVVCGQHCLETALLTSDEAFADVAGEPGRAKIFRESGTLLVSKDNRYMPLLEAS